MIAFGCSITKPEVYAGCAEAGIRRAVEPDSEVIANAAAGSLARSYNLIKEMVADREDLDAFLAGDRSHVTAADPEAERADLVEIPTASIHQRAFDLTVCRRPCRQTAEGGYFRAVHLNDQHVSASGRSASSRPRTARSSRSGASPTCINRSE